MILHLSHIFFTEGRTFIIASFLGNPPSRNRRTGFRKTVNVALCFGFLLKTVIYHGQPLPMIFCVLDYLKR